MEDDHAGLRPDRLGLSRGQAARYPKSELRFEQRRQWTPRITKLADTAEGSVVGFSVAVVDVVNAGPEGTGAGGQFLMIAVLSHGGHRRNFPVDIYACTGSRGGQAVGELAH